MILLFFYMSEAQDTVVLNDIGCNTTGKKGYEKNPE